MSITKAITVVNKTDDSALISPIAGELMASSRRIYIHDAKVFAEWLQGQGLTAITISLQSLRDYRGYLLAHHSPATAKRMLSVACRLSIKTSGLSKDAIRSDVKGIVAEDESPHIALTKEQAKALLGAIDRSSKKGLRDYALLMLLLYTGLRRFEAANLTIGDMGEQQGYHVLTVKAGKGGKRAIVKLPIFVWRDIQAYLAALDRQGLPGTSPLFVQFYKGDKWLEAGISPQTIYRLVLSYAGKAGISDLTPHGLRASFITLALEGGAKLEQVQYAARHKSPAMTERYQRRKLNLDDNAVDYIHI